MQFEFNLYGNKVQGDFPSSYDWCIPLLEVSLEISGGKPSCPKFHCSGLRDLPFTCTVHTRTGVYKMVVGDTTSFELVNETDNGSGSEPS